MLIKDSQNFAFWTRVFAEVGNQAPDGSSLNEETLMVYDGANTECYPEINILGVFRISVKKFLVISVTYDSDHDSLADVKMEIQERIEDCQSLSLFEKEKLAAFSNSN